MKLFVILFTFTTVNVAGQNYVPEIRSYLDSLKFDAIEGDMFHGTWTTDSGYASEYLTLLPDGKCKLTVPGVWHSPGKPVDGAWRISGALLTVQTPRKDLEIFVRVNNNVPEMLVPVNLMLVNALYKWNDPY